MVYGLLQLHPLVQIWSRMAPKNKDGDNHNAKIPVFTVALHLV